VMVPRSIGKDFLAEDAMAQEHSLANSIRTSRRFLRMRSNHILLKLSKDWWLTIWARELLIKLPKSIIILLVMAAKLIQSKVLDINVVFAQTLTIVINVRLRKITLIQC
jgi:hypothetical protein